ncbi:SpoIIE family protein phosphatase [Zavarzinella formosa]|uniref:SpoIIE family protein phosphatase n=1 Tax=Zavarzinella formosa TaxID=360055 RepID=UPI000308A2A4|nr:SpoIIE family protein phosphatase [Zavarzinella formosa]
MTLPQSDGIEGPTTREQNFPFHGTIAARAYEIWVVRGRAAGTYLKDWQEAETELLDGYLGERNRFERFLLAEQAVTRALAESAEITNAAPRIMQAICEALRWDVGAVWVVDDKADVLRCVNVWHAPAVEVPEFEQANWRSTLKRGVGLPGRVWGGEGIVWVPDVASGADLPLAPIADREGLHAACCFPIRSGAEFLGALEFYSRQIQEPDAQLRDMMTGIAGQITQFIERRRAEHTIRDRNRELDLARHIQQGLLPTTMPVMPGFKFGGACRFCQETGGDYYDCFAIGDTAFGLAIGDASGHGIGAALVMVQARASMRSLALSHDDPGTILARTNRCLAESLPPDHFVTVFLARIDPGTRSLLYCNAGHPSGYILDRHGDVQSVLQSTGMPLGIEPTAELPTAMEITLQPGDLLFLLTDGVTEAFSPEGLPFGIQRALDTVRGHQHETPDEIVQALLRGVAEFSEGQVQLDDLTGVVIKFEAGA